MKSSNNNKEYKYPMSKKEKSIRIAQVIGKLDKKDILTLLCHKIFAYYKKIKLKMIEDWQVLGNKVVSFIQSLKLDLKIFIKTFSIVLNREGV